jgi:hypothetical protein
MPVEMPKNVIQHLWEGANEELPNPTSFFWQTDLMPQLGLNVEFL